MSNKKKDDIPPCSRLLGIELKVKALAYLFENQGVKSISPLSWELDDIHAGIGKIIWGFTEEIALVRNELELGNIIKAQSETKKGARRNLARN